MWTSLQFVLVVAFQGSVELQDWVANVGRTINWNDFKRYGLGVHSGWAGLLTDENKHAYSMKNSTKKVMIKHIQEIEPGLVLLAGHSLWGALAKISMLQIKDLFDFCTGNLHERPMFADTVNVDGKDVTCRAKFECVTIRPVQPWRRSAE